jgi:two-component system chemotaxis sensor kinase CheA
MGSGEKNLPDELITQEMIDSFISETNDLLDNVEGNLLEVEKDPERIQYIDEAFRDIHTVKGNAGFFGFEDIEKQCMDIESTMDTVRKRRKKADNNLVTTLLDKVDSVRNAVRQLGKSSQPGKDGSTEKGAEKTGSPEGGEEQAPESEKGEEPAPGPEDSEEPLQETGPPSGEAAPGPEGGEEPIPGTAGAEEPTPAAEAREIEGKGPEFEGGYKPLGDVLVDMGATSRDSIERALDKQQKKLGEILVEQGSASEDVVQEALEEQEVQKETRKDETYKIKRKDIRVDMAKLDRLFDLMGELITAEAMVVSHPELEGKKVENFRKAAGSMSKITRSMQEITMAIRMIPLEGLFNKMRRLVRDLARKFDKKIDLSITGQDTEMDRNVIEEISDPLVHIIRNAIDHGIEDSEKRKAAGKEETGSIALSAKYEGNEIWITVDDDGGGLSREKIIKKAVDNGIVSGDPEELSDEEVWQLIFEPGFSTADQVSEISGRGVGMDVVRKNIEKLRGKIDIQSVQGQGSTITLKIPLTLAIIDGINFTIGNMQYSLAIDDVVEFQKIEEQKVTQTTDSLQVINLRGEIIPVVKLHEFFDIETGVQHVWEGTTIIVQARGKKAALLVDEVVGYKQIVIKRLPEYLEGMRAVSGCSIMGNGDVTLIIDVGSLIREELE